MRTTCHRSHVPISEHGDIKDLLDKTHTESLYKTQYCRCKGFRTFTPRAMTIMTSIFKLVLITVIYSIGLSWLHGFQKQKVLCLKVSSELCTSYITILLTIGIILSMKCGQLQNDVLNFIGFRLVIYCFWHECSSLASHLSLHSEQ